jgi:predicted RNA-binding Zn-ribbon protein involved in translation (DUF1610 family)
MGRLQEFTKHSKTPYMGVTKMMVNHKSVACPVCSVAIELSRSVFLLDFRCPHCGAALKVATLYMRIQVIFSGLVGYILAWKIGIYGPRACGGIPWGFYLLGLPIGFLVLWILSRTVPFLVRPTLVPRQRFESHLTTMNLSSDPKDDHPPDEGA